MVVFKILHLKVLECQFYIILSMLTWDAKQSPFCFFFFYFVDSVKIQATRSRWPPSPTTQSIDCYIAELEIRFRIAPLGQVIAPVSPIFRLSTFYVSRFLKIQLFPWHVWQISRFINLNEVGVCRFEENLGSEMFSYLFSQNTKICEYYQFCQKIV